MTGLSPETGRMAAEHGHVVGTLLSLSAAGPMFDAYRKRAQELGWTAGPDRFAYAGVVGVGTTREEGLRRANLAADYVRTSVVVAEPFTNPPGYNSLAANVAALKSGGKRGGFVRDRNGNPVDQRTATIEQLIESGTCFAGTPDDVYNQIKALHDSVGGFGNLLMFGQGGFLDHADTVANITPVRQGGDAAAARTQPGPGAGPGGGRSIARQGAHWLSFRGAAESREPGTHEHRPLEMGSGL